MSDKLQLYLLLALILIAGVSKAIVCPDNICLMINCGKSITKCEDNQILRPGGFCGCCKQCFTIIGENQSCSHLPLLGFPLGTFECDTTSGLVCYKGTCTKLQNIPEITQND